MVRRPAHELQREVSLDAERDIRRAVRRDAPPTVFILMAHNLVGGALHPAAIARAEQSVDEDVVGLEHAVSFEFAAPVAVGMLQAKQPILRALDALGNVVEAEVHPAIARLSRLICGLRITGIRSHRSSLSVVLTDRLVERTRLPGRSPVANQNERSPA